LERLLGCFGEVIVGLIWRVIISFLLMITKENVGYISLKLKVTNLINSKSIKPLLKSRQGNTSEQLEQTMEESLNLSSLRVFAS
jgi:NADPH-dependent 7-cyano-7-deazaguanine reductase QueF-like protein